MINQKTRDNIDKIVVILKEALTYNGQQMCENSKTHLNMMRGRLIVLSDGDVDFYFERDNSNARVGTYKITYKCTEEVEDFINSHMDGAHGL